MARPATAADPAAAPLAATRSRRIGSTTVPISSATSSPGIPTVRKVSCHGRSNPMNGKVIGGRCSSAPITVPPMMADSAIPAMNPKFKIDTARGSCSRGNRSASIEYVAGPTQASPPPTPMRARNSCKKVWASPHNAVAPLHSATPIPMIRRRLLRSTKRAIGRPRIT
jgi:hypothetical protein